MKEGKRKEVRDGKEEKRDRLRRVQIKRRYTEYLKNRKRCTVIP